MQHPAGMIISFVHGREQLLLLLLLYERGSRPDEEEVSITSIKWYTGRIKKKKKGKAKGVLREKERRRNVPEAKHESRKEISIRCYIVF